MVESVELWKRLRRRCSLAFRWLGVVPVALITLAMLILPTAMPHIIMRSGHHQKAVKWYFEAGWLRKEDTAELSRRGCDILFFKNSSCSCADEILSSMAGIHHMIYADADWKLIKDPKMKADSMHYTAWSQHRELRTAADLRPRHLPFLNMLLLEGPKAVIAAHPDLRSEDDISVFVHFPPNIFRLHVHFVSANRTMWAPPDEVFLLKKLVKSLELSKGNPIHSSWKFVHHNSLNCESWQ